MKNKYLKIFLLITLVAALAISLIACGNSTPKADDASGTWDGISWEYKKDTKTLTITGKGNMPNAESSDKVSWAAVRESVEKVVFAAKDGQNVSNIGDYAFYGMTNLKSVSLPTSITSVGKCSFAFCTSLENISIPTAVTSVGESAFEACVALKSITLPSSVAKLGDRAFAYCRALTEATVAGKVESLTPSMFTNCSALATLTVYEGLESFNEKDFTDAGIKKVEYIAGLSDTTTIKVTYKDTEGNAVKDESTETKKYGESYSVVAPEINGYTVKGTNNYTGKANGEETITLEFKYEKIVETEAPDETEPETEAPKPEKEKGLTADKIVALVVLGVVIVGICVGAVLLARSNKKQQQKGNTVRKNQNKKK